MAAAMKKLDRRTFFARAAVSIAGLSTTGCGTILHPERRGQPAGPLDWRIVALDSLFLLLFFIPGVIAFAVDFSTGAIYLPPPGYGYSGLERGLGSELTRLRLPKEELHEEGIARAVSQHLGHTIELREGAYQTEPLWDIEEFWPASQRLVASTKRARDPSVLRAQSIGAESRQ
jgi:hypothetical protein